MYNPQILPLRMDWVADTKISPKRVDVKIDRQKNKDKNCLSMALLQDIKHLYTKKPEVKTKKEMMIETLTSLA